MMECLRLLTEGMSILEKRGQLLRFGGRAATFRYVQITKFPGMIY